MHRTTDKFARSKSFFKFIVGLVFLLPLSASGLETKSCEKQAQQLGLDLEKSLQITLTQAGPEIPPTDFWTNNGTLRLAICSPGHCKGLEMVEFGPSDINQVIAKIPNRVLACSTSHLAIEQLYLYLRYEVGQLFLDRYPPVYVGLLELKKTPYQVAPTGDRKTQFRIEFK